MHTYPIRKNTIADVILIGLKHILPTSTQVMSRVMFETSSQTIAFSSFSYHPPIEASHVEDNVEFYCRASCISNFNGLTFHGIRLAAASHCPGDLRTYIFADGAHSTFPNTT